MVIMNDDKHSEENNDVENVLPSRFQIGDRCVLNFGNSGLVKNCFITGVLFVKFEVWYQVDIYPNIDDTEDESPEEHKKAPTSVTVRGYFVEGEYDRYVGMSNMPNRTTE
jgi:hypothetical protein